MKGDLSGLTPKEKAAYYIGICESLELNPALRPFDLLSLNGKQILYANKGCTEQLRVKRSVSVKRLEAKLEFDIYTVTAYLTDETGREDSDIGAVFMPETLKGEARANAAMKATTKAKRRATLSLCGLGMLDESEVETIRGAQTSSIDLEPESGSRVQGLKAQLRKEAGDA
jgi:hypothetical protein